MRSNIAVWWILTAFFLLTAVVYTAWNLIYYTGPVWDRIEWVGTLGLVGVALMAGFIAFYTQKVYKGQGGQELPEDVLTADIDDADPEMGEFSPWSWWPLAMAFALGIVIIGVSVGWWLVPIGIAIFLVTIVGWVYEYYRGNFAH